MFVERLKRKAENAGGSVVEFSTHATRLSQTCICGKREKKPLSRRIHRCSCGVVAQRDLFSAYLARFVEDGELNASAAQESWNGAEMLLQSAFERGKQTASQRPVPESFGTGKWSSEKSGSTEEERTTCKRWVPNDKAWDAVKPGVSQGMRAQESQMEFPLRTPRF